MESMSDVITKHPGGSLLLFEQRGKEDAAASSDTLRQFNSVFSIPDFMNLKYMVFLENQEMGGRKLAA